MHSWNVQHDVPLAPLTTFEVGGTAHRFVAVQNWAWLPAVLAWARAEQLPVALLGGGSNVVVSDAGWPGVVLHLPPCTEQQALHWRWGDLYTDIDVSAAVPWDRLVAATVEAGLWGLACLSGIPGLVGAAPVQNIGAYGQALADSLLAVDVLDVACGQRRRLAAQDCGLAYRDSHFKGAWQGRYIIVGLTVRLAPTLAPDGIGYPELRQRLGLSDAHAPQGLTPAAVRAAVLRLRASKSMLWDLADANHRSVGSFFTNPHVDAAFAQALRARHPEAPVWMAAGGAKLSAAWLIERAGFPKGWVRGAVGLSSRHSLAVINRGGATAAELVEAAGHIRRGVACAFGVALTPEPTFWGFEAAVPAALATPLGAECAASAAP